MTERVYLSELASRLEAVLGGRLIGVYAGGSFALGDYLAEHSDIDVAAVVDVPIAPALKRRVVVRCRHEALPCPARGLELVVYRNDLARSAGADPDIELNLNTGTGLPFRVDYETPADSHWFPIDRSILAQAGVTLTGRPADYTFAPIEPRELAPALVESVRWHGREGGRSDNAVLNACRSLRFASEGRWTSKPTAGRWAIEGGHAPAALVRAALAARRREEDPYLDVDEFLAAVESRLVRLLDRL